MTLPCTQTVERLAKFERYYRSIAHPYEWKFRVEMSAMTVRMRSLHAETAL